MQNELTSLEGWVELTKDAVVLDFHAQHPRAGRYPIRYAAIERVEIDSAYKQGWLSPKRVGACIRVVRFDRQGYSENASNDRNMMLIADEDIPAFSELAQTAMERAAESLSPKATETEKLRSGMYKKSADGNTLTARGPSAQVSEFVQGVANMQLTDSLISRGQEVQPLRRVHAKVASVTTHHPVDRRVSATRVAAGAAIAGRTGAVIGAMAQKKVSGGATKTVTLTVTGPGFEWTDEVNPSLELTARNFASEVNRRAAAQ